MKLATRNPFVEQLEALIDARVEAKLAQMTRTTSEPLYMSRGGILPAECAGRRRSFVTALATYSVPHWTEGDGTRRVYICHAADWHAARHRPAKPKPPALRVVEPSSDEELAASFLAAAGDRPTRAAGGRR